MKPVDHALARLFRAAAEAPVRDESTIAMPAALQSRVLAARRDWLARRTSDEFAALLSLIRRGLAAAAVVAVVTAVICHRLDTRRVPSVDAMVLESVAELSLLP